MREEKINYADLLYVEGERMREPESKNVPKGHTKESQSTKTVNGGRGGRRRGKEKIYRAIRLRVKIKVQQRENRRERESSICGSV